jgi:hypothetical protein
MNIHGIACEPSVDVFESSDCERHILEISWWSRADEMMLVATDRLDLHWSDTEKIRDGLTRALKRMDERRGPANSAGRNEAQP